MYRSLARKELRRKERMVGLEPDDKREIDAQCNLYNGGSGISKFPRSHCLEDLVEQEEFNKWLQAREEKLAVRKERLRTVQKRERDGLEEGSAVHCYLAVAQSLRAAQLPEAGDEHPCLEMGSQA